MDCFISKGILNMSKMNDEKHFRSNQHDLSEQNDSDDSSEIPYLSNLIVKQYHDFKRLIKKQENEISTLKEEIAAQRNQIKEGSKGGNEMQQIINEYKQQINELESVNQAQKYEIKRQNEKISQLINEVQNLSVKTAALKQNNNEDELSNKENIIRKLNFEIDQKNNEINALKKKIQTLTNKLSQPNNIDNSDKFNSDSFIIQKEREIEVLEPVAQPAQKPLISKKNKPGKIRKKTAQFSNQNNTEQFEALTDSQDVSDKQFGTSQASQSPLSVHTNDSKTASPTLHSSGTRPPLKTAKTLDVLEDKNRNKVENKKIRRKTTIKKKPQITKNNSKGVINSVNQEELPRYTRLSPPNIAIPLTSKDEELIFGDIDQEEKDNEDQITRPTVNTQSSNGINQKSNKSPVSNSDDEIDGNQKLHLISRLNMNKSNKNNKNSATSTDNENNKDDIIDSESTPNDGTATYTRKLRPKSKTIATVRNKASKKSDNVIQQSKDSKAQEPKSLTRDELKPSINFDNDNSSDSIPNPVNKKPSKVQKNNRRQTVNPKKEAKSLIKNEDLFQKTEKKEITSNDGNSENETNPKKKRIIRKKTVKKATTGVTIENDDGIKPAKGTIAEIEKEIMKEEIVKTKEATSKTVTYEHDQQEMIEVQKNVDNPNLNKQGSAAIKSKADWLSAALGAKPSRTLNEKVYQKTVNLDPEPNQPPVEKAQEPGKAIIRTPRKTGRRPPTCLNQ